MNKSQCTICQDFLTLADIYACICGHTFHNACISQWNQTNNTCPQCRTFFGNNKPLKLYFDLENSKDEEDEPGKLKNKIQDLELKVEEKEKDMKKEHSKLRVAKKELKGAKSELEAMRNALDREETVNNALKRQLTFLEKHKEEAQKARHRAERLQRDLDNLQMVEELIKGEREEVELMLKNFHGSQDSLNQVVTSFVIMKREFEKLKESKEKMNEDKKSQRKEIDDLRRRLQMSLGEKKSLKDQLKLAEIDLQHVEKERQNAQKKCHALEQAFASPSPRASAIKRLLRESPAPMSAKRLRQSSSQAAEDDVTSVDENEIEDSSVSSNLMNDFQNDFQNDSFQELASEIGLKIVNTTTVTLQSQKRPLADSRKVLNIKPSTHRHTVSSSNCPVIQKGYNGLGGQSKFLIPSGAKKLSSRVKIPKSSTANGTKTINSHFLSGKHPNLPNFQFSP